jgi:hypothetical protein
MRKKGGVPQTSKRCSQGVTGNGSPLLDIEEMNSEDVPDVEVWFSGRMII